jgi:hypothetical protein
LSGACRNLPRSSFVPSAPVSSLPHERNHQHQQQKTSSASKSTLPTFEQDSSLCAPLPMTMPKRLQQNFSTPDSNSIPGPMLSPSCASNLNLSDTEQQTAVAETDIPMLQLDDKYTLIYEQDADRNEQEPLLSMNVFNWILLQEWFCLWTQIRDCYTSKSAAELTSKVMVLLPVEMCAAPSRGQMPTPCSGGDCKALTT